MWSLKSFISMKADSNVSVPRLSVARECGGESRAIDTIVRLSDHSNGFLGQAGCDRCYSCCFGDRPSHILKFIVCMWLRNINMFYGLCGFKAYFCYFWTYSILRKSVYFPWKFLREGHVICDVHYALKYSMLQKWNIVWIAVD